MRIFRRSISKRLVHEQMPGCARYPLLTPDNVGYFHGIVVNDVSQVIRRVTVRFQHHKIIDGAVFKTYVAVNNIVEFSLAFEGYFKAYHRLDAAALKSAFSSGLKLRQWRS